jgi:glycogen debranching enzyme
MDEDGLLAAGVPGVQLTWMDAKIGDWVVTPRIGKPVEIQALWLNALAVGAEDAPRWASVLARASASFERRFWNPSTGHLNDVVDVDHQPGTIDATCRPNQVLAIGGLPLTLLDDLRARSVIDQVERRLLTPLGLRSLAPDAPGYTPHYSGGARERDAAYHQGTVWPWLMGAFVDAWLRVHGRSEDARREAATRFLSPFEAHLREAGLGHVSEIADGDAPHIAAGCPFQAWSLGELLRMRHLVSRDAAPRRRGQGRSALAASAQT